MLRNNGRHNFRSPIFSGPIASLSLNFAATQSLPSGITFTRSTTAPYYDGVTTSLAEQNLLLQSNTFSNAAWVKTGGTVATGVTDPLGGTTASSFTASSLNATLYQTVTLTNTPYTESIWIQRVTGVGVINLTLDGVTLSPVTITGSWAKYTYTATPAAGSKTVGIQVVTIGDVINIYGSQLENRSAATATNITTTAILQNFIPKLLTAAINAARFTSNPVSSVSLGLVVEPSSTNLQTYSQDFTNAVWNKSGCSITTAANIAPDGTQTAQLLVENTATNVDHRIRISGITKTANQVLVNEVYIKPYGRYVILSMENAGTGLYTSFDVVNNLYNDFASGAGWTRGVTTITPVGNGWYRCSISGTTDTSLSVNNRIGLSNTYPGVAQQTYTGNGYSGVYVWGSQLEGPVLTSYIPTTTAQVTRAADTPLLAIDTWYTTTQGTWFAQVNLQSISGTPRIVGASPSSKAPIEISSQAGAMYDASTTISTANIFTVNTTQKIASTWSGTSGSICLNAGTVATGSQPNGYANLTNIGIGYNATSNDNYMNGAIANINFYQPLLTSAQLQTLTGL